MDKTILYQDSIFFFFLVIPILKNINLHKNPQSNYYKYIRHLTTSSILTALRFLLL